MTGINSSIHLDAYDYRQTLESSSLPEVQAIMSGYCCEHQLTVGNAAALHFRQSRQQLPSLQLCQIEYGTAARVQYDDLKSFYTISLPTTGEQVLTLGGHKTFSDSLRGIVISPSQSVFLEMSDDCSKNLVRIPRARLESALFQMMGRRLDQPLVFESSMDIESGKASSWWRTIRFIQQEQEQDGSLYHSLPLLEDAEQLLIEGLLLGQPHNYSAALNTGGGQVLPAFVRRAEDFIRENAHKPITKDDIVEAAGVPCRTLYEGFKRFGRRSPMKYLRDIRLQRVREDIKRSGGNARITDIATKWWFMHLGRFSSEYRQFFGESPSETLRMATLQ